MKTSSVLLIGAIAAAHLLGRPAEAALMLTVTDTFNAPLTITDGGAGDAAPATGFIAYAEERNNGYFGSLYYATSMAPGDSSGGGINVSANLQHSLSGPGSLNGLNFEATDTFAAPSPIPATLGTFATLTTSTAMGSATYEGYADSITTGPKTLYGTSGDTDATPFTPGASYTLRATASTSIPAGDAAEIGETVFVTLPEPAALAPLALGALALFPRRRCVR